jgi:CheY-like chemotaxis protein
MPGKVLIVDDDPEIVEAMTNLLDAKGYTVVSATNGKEGVETAKKEKPGLILLDVMMTTKSEGFDVARSLSKDESLRSIPVVLITGVRREMNLPFGFEPDPDWLPVKAVLEKPVKPDTLLKVVEENIVAGLA